MTNQPHGSVEARVAAAGKLHKRVRQALSENLAPDEPIEVVIRGVAGQAIIGTDRRLFVLKPGFLAGATFGIEATSWTYGQITGIQIHTDVNGAVVIIQAPGQSGLNTSRFSSKDEAPMNAPNAVVVRRPMKAPRKGLDEVKNGVSRLRDLMNRGEPVAVRRDRELSDELHRLNDLHRSGVLSNEEFAKAKAHLLSAE